MKLQDNQEAIRRQQEVIKKQEEVAKRKRAENSKLEQEKQESVEEREQSLNTPTPKTESSSTLQKQPTKQGLNKNSLINIMNEMRNKKIQEEKEEEEAPPEEISATDRMVNLIRSNKFQVRVVCGFGYLAITMILGLVLSVVTLTFTMNPFKWMLLTFTHPVTLIISIILLIGVIGFMKLSKKNTIENNDANYTISDQDAYGSAKKGDIYSEEARDNIQIEKDFLDMDDVVFGEDDYGNFVGVNPKTSLARYMYIVGMPGSGKTTGYIHNMIIQLIKQGKSVIMTDPKGELRRDTYELFRDNGYEVKQLNFKNLIASDSWDMLGDAGVDEIDYLVNVIIKNTEHTEYDAAEGNLLTALCLYVLTYEGQTKEEVWMEYKEKWEAGENPDLYEYQDRANRSPIKDRTIGAAYNLLGEYDEDEIDAMFSALPQGHPASVPYKTLQSKGNFKTNIRIGLQTRLNLFRSILVQRVLGKPDIDTTLPIKKKCAYFLIFPDQEKTYAMLQALFVEFLFKSMVEFYDNYENKKELQKVHFLLDEFCLVGKFENFQDRLAGCRGRGIEATLITQSLSQLKTTYPNDEWANIIGCCDIQIILGTNDEFTAEYYSKKSGEATIDVANIRMDNAQGLLNNSQMEMGSTESVGRRMVYTPDEIKKIRKKTDDHPLGDIIVFMAGDDSYKLHKYPSFMNPTYKRCASVKSEAISHIPKWLENLAKQTHWDNKDAEIYKLITDRKKWPKAFKELVEKYETEYERKKAHRAKASNTKQTSSQEQPKSNAKAQAPKQNKPKEEVMTINPKEEKPRDKVAEQREKEKAKSKEEKRKESMAEALANGIPQI